MRSRSCFPVVASSLSFPVADPDARNGADHVFEESPHDGDAPPDVRTQKLRGNVAQRCGIDQREGKAILFAGFFVWDEAGNEPSVVETDECDGATTAFFRNRGAAVYGEHGGTILIGPLW